MSNDAPNYASPPLVEAICDFQFLPGSPWDATVLGLVYDRIKDDFSVKQPQPGPMFNLRFSHTPVSPPMMPPALMERMQFRRPDNSALIQVGPNNLTVNHLKPYAGWPRFREMIIRVLAAYREVADPKGLSQIALRYINRINIPGDRVGPLGVKISDYLLAQPGTPAAVPQEFTAWAQRVQTSWEPAQGVLVLQSGNAQGDATSPIALLLDLALSAANASQITLEDAPAWLEKAHEGIETVFEECLGPKARELFGPRN